MGSLGKLLGTRHTRCPPDSATARSMLGGVNIISDTTGSSLPRRTGSLWAYLWWVSTSGDQPMPAY